MWSFFLLILTQFGTYHVEACKITEQIADMNNIYRIQHRSSFVRPDSSQVELMLENRKKIIGNEITPQANVENKISSREWNILNGDLQLNKTQEMKDALENLIIKEIKGFIVKRERERESGPPREDPPPGHPVFLKNIYYYFNRIVLDPTACHNNSVCLSAYPPASLAALLSMGRHLTLDGLELTTDLWSWLAVFTKLRTTKIFTLSNTNLDSCGVTAERCQDMCASSAECLYSEGGVGGCTLIKNITCGNDVENCFILTRSLVSCDNTNELIEVMANMDEVELVNVEIANCTKFIKSLATGLQKTWIKRIKFQGSIIETCHREVEEMARELRWIVKQMPGQNRISINRCVRVTESTFMDLWIFNEQYGIPNPEEMEQNQTKPNQTKPEGKFWMPGNCMVVNERGLEMVWDKHNSSIPKVFG